jgi:addiction module RelE/StbE family toxin
MNNIFFSTLAKDDLQDIWNFTAAESPQGARKIIEKIHSSIAKLADFPHMGPQRKDLTIRDVRFLVVSRYIIVYRTENKSVEIVRILSGFRDIISLLS